MNDRVIADSVVIQNNREVFKKYLYKVFEITRQIPC
jgi:hypothetical protein